MYECEEGIKETYIHQQLIGQLLHGFIVHLYALWKNLNTKGRMQYNNELQGRYGWNLSCCIDCHCWECVYSFRPADSQASRQQGADKTYFKNDPALFASEWHWGCNSSRTKPMQPNINNGGDNQLERAANSRSTRHLARHTGKETRTNQKRQKRRTMFRACKCIWLFWVFWL